MTTHPEHSRDTTEPGEQAVATVLGSLANGMFRLQMTDGREVAAHAALDLRKVFTRLLPGDRVLLELSPFDPNHGRICNLIKSSENHPPKYRQRDKGHRETWPSQSQPHKPQQREQS